MKILFATLLSFPTLASADLETIQAMDSAHDWVMTKATCAEVRGLFLVDPAAAADMPEHDVISLQFIHTYLQGFASARGDSYASVLAEFGAFCRAHPQSVWVEGP